MVLTSRKSTYFFGLLLVLLAWSCAGQKTTATTLKTGAERTAAYLPMLSGKRVGIVANQTSVIFKSTAPNKMAKHLVDSLLARGVNITKVFAPEHGFRGKADAGEMVKDGIDTQTGLPIVSLYGKNKKPSQAQLQGIDVIVFDIQDVGARFYTYISTLHYVMEACAEMNIPLVLLDRPNPNGHYIDGPVLESKHKSFVGMHPVPVVYGMTIGEYGQMINGEKWLANGIQCDLTVVALTNYTHSTRYSLPIKPSPNLPNDKSINLYPSLCFFEGTNVSAGRGTDWQFQIYGSPYLDNKGFSFTPKSNEGAKYPKYRGEECYGEDLRTAPHLSRINLSWLLKAFVQNNTKGSFFNSFFTKLAGTEKLEQQILSGIQPHDIRASWQKDLEHFKQVRQKYLLYK